VKSRYILVTTLTAGLAAFVVGTALAQDPSASSSHSSQHDRSKGSADRMRSDMTGSADQQFMMKAAQGGLAEVEMGKLAKDHASSQNVKDFGQNMVDDHSKANDELKDLASKKNVTLPTDVDAKDKATMDRLSALNGAAFDKAYMRHMVSDHKKDISEFQKEASSGSDTDVKSWASKTLPTLQHHLQMAEDAAKAVNAK